MFYTKVHKIKLQSGLGCSWMIPDRLARICNFSEKVKNSIGMHRILILPDIRPAGYPVRAGYRISRPDTWFDKYIFGKISNKFVKTIIDFG
jgi:hypothetical protein